MTITTTTDSLELISSNKSSVEKKASKSDLLDSLIKKKEYLNFFEAIEEIDLSRKGMKTLVARKIRKLDFEKVSTDPELTSKLVTLLTGTHPTLIDKEFLQRGLINKLQKAINKESPVTQLLCLKLINTIKDEDLEEKLKKTKNEDTVTLIRTFKVLSADSALFSIKSDQSIAIKPSQLTTTQLVKIQQFLSTFKWSNIHLNLENDEQVLSNDELKRLLMIIRKDSSPYQSLKLKGHKLSIGLVKDLATLINASPNINKLNLKDCQINHSMLKHLAKIWDKQGDPLTKLNVSGNRLSDKGVKLLLSKIPTSTRLDTLKLESTHIDNESLTTLCHKLNTWKTPIHIKLSEAEVKEDDREFINFMCKQTATVEFVKAKEPVVIDEVKKIEEVALPSDQETKETITAKVYDGKLQELRQATEIDLETFDAVYIDDREAIATELTTEILDKPGSSTLTINQLSIPTENIRILIEEDLLTILGYWTTYRGSEPIHEWYYEELEYTGTRLKPETFTLDKIDDSTLQISIETDK